MIGPNKYVPIRMSALQAASSRSIDKVKVLLDAGADINMTDENGWTAIICATILNRMDILLYLLQNGADFTMKHDVSDYFPKGREKISADVLFYLRRCKFPLESEIHKQKIEVIKFLKEKGMDYSKEPIPDMVVEWAKNTYPDSWQEYLENY